MEKQFEILDLPPDARQLVAECEVNGARTVFARNGRPVAILVSYDEYLALRETIEIGRDSELRKQIENAKKEIEQGAMTAPEDLLNDRLRIANSALQQWTALSDGERAAARQAMERIDDDPISGAPLYEPLRGYWSMHADAIRIVYTIVPEARIVVILNISRR